MEPPGRTDRSARLDSACKSSLVRWEKRGNQLALIEAHIEIVLRIKVLRKLEVKIEYINEAIGHVEDVEKFRSAKYKKFTPTRVPQALTFG